MSDFDHDPSEKDFAETNRIVEEHAKEYPNHLAVIRGRKWREEFATISDNVARALAETRSDDQLRARYPRRWAEMVRRNTPRVI
jgi:hypothetical protein